MGSERIDLAHEAQFVIGEVEVEPSYRRIRRGADEEFIEPRVMQVLVALARANGAVVSRTDLIDQCWNGRVVGDNAIHRAVSRVREIGVTLGCRSFEIETIKGVGYRLKSGAHAVGSPVPGSAIRPVWMRRTLLAGAGAGGAAALAFGVAPIIGRSETDRTGRKLFDRAEAARRDYESEVTAEQAISLYRAAVQRSPGFTDAWAGIALANCQLMDVVADARVRDVVGRARSAARRALSLDPNDIKARTAMVLAAPRFRRWKEQQERLQALEEERDTWEIPSERARISADLGQPAEAVAHARQALSREPMLARTHSGLFQGLWILGRLHDAEDIMAQARLRWPRHYGFWSVLFRYFVTLGRYEEADLLLRQEQGKPLGLSPRAIPIRRRLLHIVAGEDRALRPDFVRHHVEDARMSPWALRNSIRNLALIGERDMLYQMLDGFFRGSGQFGRRLNPYSRMPTAWLYAPYFDDYRGDEAFRSLEKFLGAPVSLPA